MLDAHEEDSSSSGNSSHDRLILAVKSWLECFVEIIAGINMGVKIFTNSFMLLHC